MKLTIDNVQGLGPQDYSAAIDVTIAPRVERKLNRPTELRFSLAPSAPDFVVPVSGARVILAKASGVILFTGYLTEAPRIEYLGWGEQGSVVRYSLMAKSDEVLLDQKALPNRAPFVNRSAGSALQQLAQDVLPGGFDRSGVQDVDTLAMYAVNPQQKFSEHAGALALAVRGSYRAMSGALFLSPVGASIFPLNESDPGFTSGGLKLESPNLFVNDATVIGLIEPQDYVRDYFVGDGLSLRFFMSQQPFGQSRGALISENYLNTALDPTVWAVSDPASAISVASQTLQVAGGTGGDGQTTVAFVEQIEMGGALQLQHGDVSFSGPSQGVLGGLYSGAISTSACVAGFQVSPAGGVSTIQALISGSLTGPVITVNLAHRYVLTTFIYSMEVYRSQETYHSSGHPAGSGWGGASIAADVRVVLDLHEIDPANPATLVAAATVLYDGVISGAAGFCTYALVNAVDLQVSIAYTYVAHISLAEVRTALPGASYVTQLAGPLSSGTTCQIVSSPALSFFPQYVPALNELIVVSYRGSGRAVAEVMNSGSVATLQSGADDGRRGAVRVMKAPSSRTSSDCENAALAILEDGAAAAWLGSYETWSDVLPGAAEDIFPGDALVVNVPSRSAAFTAIVRQIDIEIADPANDRGIYTIQFANDLAVSLATQEEDSATSISIQNLPQLATTQVGSYYGADVREAQITAITSTTVQVDAGITPGTGGGFEVRLHDYGWGTANDRNLFGRFSSQTFTLTRLARTQNYFIRMYDSSSPPRYSRYSAALHVDYPF